MNQEARKIKNFTDLNAWIEAHKLVLYVYKITMQFPKEEQFGLINQIRRAVVSVTSNIAEGFSRQSYREKIQFYSMAQGSLTELQNQILVAQDVGFPSETDFQILETKTLTSHKLISGLIKSSKKILNS